VLLHSGLSRADRELAERAFASRTCQVLVTTSAMAWSDVPPARLVVVKGTEFFNARAGRYEQVPFSDVARMCECAGAGAGAGAPAPQRGQGQGQERAAPPPPPRGVAVIMTEDSLKPFVMTCLREPLPVESALLPEPLTRWLNAEVSARAVRDVEHALALARGTFLALRLRVNPSFYGVPASDAPDAFLDARVRDALAELERDGCVSLEQGAVRPLLPGELCARHALRVDTLVRLRGACRGGGGGGGGAPRFSFADAAGSVRAVWEVLAECPELASSVAVGARDAELNALLAERVRFGLARFKRDPGSASAKAFLLLQAHAGRARLPLENFALDARDVAGVACGRLLPALVQVAAAEGDLPAAWAAALALQTLVARSGGAALDAARAPPASVSVGGAARVTLRADGALELRLDEGDDAGAAWVVLAVTQAEAQRRATLARRVVVGGSVRVELGADVAEGLRAGAARAPLRALVVWASVTGRDVDVEVEVEREPPPNT